MSYSLNQLCTHSSFCQFWQRQGDHFSFFWSSDFCASVESHVTKEELTSEQTKFQIDVTNLKLHT